MFNYRDMKISYQFAFLSEFIDYKSFLFSKSLKNVRE